MLARFLIGRRHYQPNATEQWWRQRGLAGLEIGPSPPVMRPIVGGGRGQQHLDDGDGGPSLLLSPVVSSSESMQQREANPLQMQQRSP